MKKVSQEDAERIGQQIIARTNLNLNDDVKNAMELAPAKKRGEVISAAYRISTASLISERRASAIAIPSLSTEKEFSRRFMMCFRVYAEMRDPRGLRCTHQMSLDYMMVALFCELHGGDWRAKINATSTYNVEAVTEFADRAMN